tara:strand:+ start:529 stop:756 length:228 start_codon:yes stop_codon:yes gene_type:complete
MIESPTIAEENPPRPTEPGMWIVFNNTTKEIVDVRLPGEEGRKAPKGCTIGAVLPGEWRMAEDLLHAEPWPAEEA